MTYHGWYESTWNGSFIRVVQKQETFEFFVKISTLKLPALILTCKISCLKYISLGRRVKRIDFGRADVYGVCAQLAAVDWRDLFLDNRQLC
jgi:hypothetical protein